MILKVSFIRLRQKLMSRNKNFRWQASVMKNLQKAIETWMISYFQNWNISHDFFSRTYVNQFTNISQISIHVDRKIIMIKNMHFVIRFYNKHHVDFAFSNAIDSNNRRIKSNQHEERIAFNLDQYESDHEKNANERTTRMQQQTTTRIKKAIQAKTYIVQNDDDEESIRKKQTLIQKSIRKKQTSIQTIAIIRVQEKKKKTTSSSFEKNTTSKEKKMT